MREMATSTVEMATPPHVSATTMVTTTAFTECTIEVTTAITGVMVITDGPVATIEVTAATTTRTVTIEVSTATTGRLGSAIDGQR